MSPAERELLCEAFGSNRIAPHVDAFERELAEYVPIGHSAAA
jgi:hypothetical protein